MELLAHLIDQPNYSFQHLVHLSPKLKAIYNKVSKYLHNYEFNVAKPFCHEHDYAIRMTELRYDAQALLKQLKNNNDEYPYLNFLKDMMVNIVRLTMEHQAKKNGE